MATKKATAPKLSMLGAGDLNTLIAQDTELPIADVRKVTKALAATVGQAVAEGYEVNVFGICKIKFAYSPARPRRKGDNPLTGETGVWFAAKPESLRLVASPLASARNGLPSARSKVGKNLVEHFTALKDFREKAKAARERKAKREAADTSKPTGAKRKG